MRIVEPDVTIMTDISVGAQHELKMIEKAARTAYRSKSNSNFEHTKSFIKFLIKNGHESPLEHSILTVKFICDRGISHEIVRHRLCAFTQESTRYCNYSIERGDMSGEIEVIKPNELCQRNEKLWEDVVKVSEYNYIKLIESGITPEIARSVLPTCLATRLIVTANYREWRHILSLRTKKDAHPQIRKLMGKLLNLCKFNIPVVFDDIKEEK